MPASTTRSLGELEATVLSVLWNSSAPLSVRDVLGRVQRRPPLAYTTVLTVLDLGADACVQRHRHEAQVGDQRRHEDRAEPRAMDPLNTASSSLSPRCRIFSTDVTITSPFSTATPDRAMRPTAAEIDIGSPRP
ncbi:BlaI/MecI/CopY family transcriptional regulator [Sorangium sp. So ce1097]|uniref:BlaI/MecI/CopY family transcriptional regulator n=1 Tax=Sorangium sp. So ce1097 TaxID=3133330 RepID=UPI003F63C9D7